MRAILLKGCSIQRLLYVDSWRSYGDIDLLVAPNDWDDALVGLHELAFEEVRQPPNEAKLARPLRRPDGTIVDLHRSLIGVSAGPQRCWDVLSAHTEPLRTGGDSVEVLRPAALVALIALHAAQHGRNEAKPLVDLVRAVEQIELETWKGAVTIAEQLGALEPLVAGLGLVQRGPALVARMGLSNQVSVPVRLRAGSAPRSSQELAWVLTAKGPERRRLLRIVLLPTTDELQQRAWASRVLGWPGGVVLSRVVWLARLVTELPKALSWYIRCTVRRPRRAGRGPGHG